MSFFSFWGNTLINVPAPDKMWHFLRNYTSIIIHFFSGLCSMYLQPSSKQLNEVVWSTIYQELTDIQIIHTQSKFVYMYILCSHYLHPPSATDFSHLPGITKGTSIGRWVSSLVARKIQSFCLAYDAAFIILG